MSAALPTRREEAWRYSDLEAVAKLWPLPKAEQIIVPSGGSFSRVVVQDKGGIVQLSLSLGKQARANLHLLNLGGGYGRIEIDAVLHEAAKLNLVGVQLGDASQTLEIVTRVLHAEPCAQSSQQVRSVMGAKATGSYLGRIEVAKDAQGSNASQSSKAMLLARTATANTKPELIIHADDVQCAHGATVGELDAAALFYLQARGLSPSQARALLIEAFISDALETIDDEASRTRLWTTLEQKLKAMLPDA